MVRGVLEGKLCWTHPVDSAVYLMRSIEPVEQ